MKLTQILASTATGDAGATIVALEAGDAILVGFVAANVYGNAEDAFLITLSAGPSCAENNVEIAVPFTAWGAFVSALNERTPKTVL